MTSSLLTRFAAGGAVLLIALLPRLSHAQVAGAAADTVVLKSGVKYWTHQSGSGERPQAGQRVWIHYTGKLDDGRIFDTSGIRGKPLKFTVGKGEVIPGVDEVVAMLHVGQKVTAFIPAKSGYGPVGQPEDPDDVNTAYRIPPNADLFFDIELVKVQ